MRIVWFVCFRYRRCFCVSFVSAVLLCAVFYELVLKCQFFPNLVCLWTHVRRKGKNIFEKKTTQRSKWLELLLKIKWYQWNENEKVEQFRTRERKLKTAAERKQHDTGRQQTVVYRFVPTLRCVVKRCSVGLPSSSRDECLSDCDQTSATMISLQKLHSTPSPRWAHEHLTDRGLVERRSVCAIRNFTANTTRFSDPRHHDSKEIVKSKIIETRVYHKLHL